MSRSSEVQTCGRSRAWLGRFALVGRPALIAGDGLLMCAAVAGSILGGDDDHRATAPVAHRQEAHR